MKSLAPNGKKAVSFGLIAVMTLLLTSCFSIPKKVVFDEEWPAEDTAKVFFAQGIHVFSLNGINVDKIWYGDNWWSNKSAWVTLPAGETEVDYDLHYVQSNGNSTITYSAKDLKLVYTFEAGGDYDLKFTSKGGFLGIGAQYGIALYRSSKEIEFWELNFR